MNTGAALLAGFAAASLLAGSRLPQNGVQKPGIAGSGLSAQQQEQGQGPAETQAAPAPNLFLDGWMAELLYADRAAARQAYLAAMEQPDLRDHQSELAILRLMESNWIESDRQRYREMLERRGVFVPGDRGNRRLEDLPTTPEFAEALAQGDQARLAELRGRIDEFVAANPGFRIRRQLVEQTLPTLREPETDPFLEELKGRLETARRAGDDAEAELLRRRIRSLTDRRRMESLRQRFAEYRLMGKRWADMTQLHLAGRHRRAEGMESLIGNRDRFGSRAPIPTRESLQQQITGWDVATRQARLDEAVRRLTDGRLIRWRGLLDQERSVLEALRQRLVELRAAGRVDQALQLMARTPYRDRLLRPPTRRGR